MALALGLVAVLLVVWVLLPREAVGMTPFGGDLPADLDAYLAAAEAKAGVPPEVARHVRWAGTPGQATPVALVYLHGYSATWREISPAVEDVADALGANVHFARMTGHGLPGAALAQAVAGDWVRDATEAVAIGRRLGRRVVVIGTSTGAPWAVLAGRAGAPADGYVFVSPNFALKNLAGRLLLSQPLARRWVPWVAGAWRTWTPLNDDQARYWTTGYPTAALVPMAAAVRAARRSDLSAMGAPLLVLFRDEDKVVDARATRRVIARWGGPVTVVQPELAPGDDPEAHVIAGAIMSPGATAQVVGAMVDWLRAGFR